MKLKKCSSGDRCVNANPQPIDNFFKNRAKKDGLTNHRKKCFKLISKAINLKNRDKYNKQRREYRLKNRDKWSYLSLDAVKFVVFTLVLLLKHFPSITTIRPARCVGFCAITAIP